MRYKLIDTASVYRNEVHIGQVIQKMIPHSFKREDIFITSKLGPADHGSGITKAAALRSLKSLLVDYLDLYLIHWPGVSKTKPDSPKNSELRKQSWLEMETLYHSGMFKAIGVSNYTVKHLEELLGYCSVVPAVLQITFVGCSFQTGTIEGCGNYFGLISKLCEITASINFCTSMSCKPHINQFFSRPKKDHRRNMVEIHPYLTQKSLRAFCSEHNIHVQAYSSLGSGDGCEELLSDPSVVNIAQEQGRTCAQILLRWAVQQGISVIPKTKRTEKLKENFTIFDFELSDEQMERLNNLDQEKHYCWDPTSIK